MGQNVWIRLGWSKTIERLSKDSLCKMNKHTKVELKGGWGIWGNGLNGEPRLAHKQRWSMRPLQNK